VRVGFTASRKVGNAVLRNRARRRLRAVAAQVLAQAEPGNDFVLIARPATVDRDYQALVGDLVAGLKRLKLYRGEPR
jgi:ribonuclease P protein component